MRPAASSPGDDLNESPPFKSAGPFNASQRDSMPKRRPLTPKLPGPFGGNMKQKLKSGLNVANLLQEAGQFLLYCKVSG